MKAFFKFITVVILLLILALLFLWLFKTPLLSSYLSKKMRVGVSIEQTNLSMSHAKIVNLEMDNVSNYKSSKALTIGQIHLNYSLNGLHATPTYVDLLQLQDMTITLECNDPLCSSNNWDTIMSGMRKGGDKDYLIGKVEIRNLRIDILGSSMKPNGVSTTRIDSLDFVNVTSKEGIPLKEIITEIFIKANMQKYFKNLLQTPGKLIREVLPGLKLGAVAPAASGKVPEQLEKQPGTFKDKKDQLPQDKSLQKKNKVIEKKGKAKDVLGMEIPEENLEVNDLQEAITQEQIPNTENLVEEISEEPVQESISETSNDSSQLVIQEPCDLTPEKVAPMQDQNAKPESFLEKVVILDGTSNEVSQISTPVSPETSSITPQEESKASEPAAVNQ